MPSLQERNEDRALERWARSEGYCDMDTYLRIGGSLMDARRSLRHRIEMAQLALAAITRIGVLDDHRPAPVEQIEIGPEALARAEAEQNGERDEAFDNPHHGHASDLPIQGFER